MLNIYYGRDNLDKERFMYDQIAQRGYGPSDPVVVIVPDQYTLEAERQAFRHLKSNGLMGLDIYSMSRLGHNILAEVGGGRGTFVDKYGRQMILTRIARQENDNLQVFRGSMAKSSFIELANNFISELKQYGVTPEALAEVRDSIPAGELLHRKLSDLTLIYSRYQEEIAGKYTDSEDYIDLYVGKINQSKQICGKKIWVYGFDSFAPKSIEVLRGIMGASEEANVILTWDQSGPDADLFSLTGTVRNNLMMAATEAGCPLGDNAPIPSDYLVKKASPSLANLESQLFVASPRTTEDHDGITITEAANAYSEAESAAAFVLHLLRDEGYRRRDIALVCNDLSSRGQIASRIFQEYGMTIFTDNKRSIDDSPIAIFLLSSLAVVAKKYRSQDIFRTLKTGLTDLPGASLEELEIYAGKYRIRGSMWKSPFRYGAHEYEEEGLERLNEIRESIVEIFRGVEDLAKHSKTVEDFVRGYYLYLTETLHLEERVDSLIKQQEDAGHADLASQTEQIFGMVIRILDQIVELTGEDPFDLEDFLEIFTVGLAQIEVGILPSSIDDLMMGTMQRTRAGNIRALVILGANDGVLPCNTSDEGLFALSEIDELAARGKEICKVDQVRIQEERLAIYRNMSRPSDHVWIGYSTGDAEGKSIRRSELIDDILNIYPGLTITPDILNLHHEQEMVLGDLGTMRHLVENMRRHRKGSSKGDLWDAVEDWYRQQDPELMASIDRCLAFENLPSPLTKPLSRLLFQERMGDRMTLSPSRIETYARCPFQYYLRYGLRPQEIREFEADSRSIGEVYHDCMMRATMYLSAKGIWDTVTMDECGALVDRIIGQIAETYKDGLLDFSNEEKYKKSRIRETCLSALWMLVEQAREGEIQLSDYEVAFGVGCKVPAIPVKAGDQTIYLEGKIDRLDLLRNGRANIIDYKSSEQKMDEPEVRSGYRLQLMIYMKAARGVAADPSTIIDPSQTDPGMRRPAGVFYFHIQDPRLDGSDLPASLTAAMPSAQGTTAGGADAESVSTQISDQELASLIRDQLKQRFTLKGILVDEADNVEEVAGHFEDKSEVTGNTRKKDGTIRSNAQCIIMSQEEFDELSQQVDDKLSELIQNMEAGQIPIRPMRSDQKSPCNFCQYKSICRFDLGFAGCEYVDVE